MLNQNDQIFHRLDPFVMPLLNGISQGQIIGACRRPINVHSVKYNNGNVDCIDLIVPYADQTLKWTILFDPEYPELGPDFIFNDENFLVDPDVDTLMKHVPSLAKWNYLQSDSLFTVIKELLAHYKDHQIDLLRNQNSERLICEYESLIHSGNLCADDVEVILNSGPKSAEAKFFIKLEMDFSKLPQRIKRPSNDAVMLLVTFSAHNWRHVVPQLFLSKSVEEIFGNQEYPQIPHFNNDDMLTEYVPKIKKFLSDKVDHLILCFKKKKEFMSSLLVLLRGSVVEYDAVEFNKATFLVEKKDFHFFIHFKIPAGFPKEKPEVILQSAYHMDQNGKLLTQSVTKFHFNLQMDHFHMILNILSHIEEKEVESFQVSCTKRNRF